MVIEQLLDTYYDGLAKRTGWEATIADAFVFRGGTPNSGSNGKPAYLEAVHRFARIFETVNVKTLIVQRDVACAVVTYDVISPAGQRATIDIAEVWTVRDGRLSSLAIYFDTARWNALMTA